MIHPSIQNTHPLCRTPDIWCNFKNTYLVSDHQKSVVSSVVADVRSFNFQISNRSPTEDLPQSRKQSTILANPDVPRCNQFPERPACFPVTAILQNCLAETQPYYTKQMQPVSLKTSSPVMSMPQNRSAFQVNPDVPLTQSVPRKTAYSVMLMLLYYQNLNRSLPTAIVWASRTTFLHFRDIKGHKAKIQQQQTQPTPGQQNRQEPQNQQHCEFNFSSVQCFACKQFGHIKRIL